MMQPAHIDPGQSEQQQRGRSSVNEPAARAGEDLNLTEALKRTEQVAVRTGRQRRLLACLGPLLQRALGIWRLAAPEPTGTDPAVCCGGMRVVDQQVFIATVVIELAADQRLELDARASDAVILALGQGVPILAAEELIAQAARPLHQLAD